MIHIVKQGSKAFFWCFCGGIGESSVLSILYHQGFTMEAGTTENCVGDA